MNHFTLRHDVGAFSHRMQAPKQTSHSPSVGHAPDDVHRMAPNTSTRSTPGYCISLLFPFRNALGCLGLIAIPSHNALPDRCRHVYIVMADPPRFNLQSSSIFTFL